MNHAISPKELEGSPSLLIVDSWPSVQQFPPVRQSYTPNMRITHAILAISVFTFLVAIPSPGHARQAAKGQGPFAPHLMNDDEFALFLKQLDKSVLRWEEQIKDVDVSSMHLDSQDGEELERSYDLSLQCLENTREEIQKLSLKQTLRCDLLLLVDLNDLARNLDSLDRELANPGSVGGNSAAQKSLRYARKVLGIDVALAPNISEFQRHLLALSGVIDSSLNQAEESDQALAQK